MYANASGDVDMKLHMNTASGGYNSYITAALDDCKQTKDKSRKIIKKDTERKGEKASGKERIKRDDRDVSRSDKRQLKDKKVKVVPIPYNIMNDSSIKIDSDRVIVGACVAIPYLSSDGDKIILNAAILFEWITYHLKLNMKLFIYDRDGGHYQSTFHGEYSKQRGLNYDLEKHENLHYHDYTIVELLGTSVGNYTYDNTETSSDTLLSRASLQSMSRLFPCTLYEEWLFLYDFALCCRVGQDLDSHSLSIRSEKQIQFREYHRSGF